MKCIKIQRLRWLGYGLRNVFASDPSGGCRRKGRPRLRWTKQVDENLTTLCIRNWRQAATARDVWRRKLAEANPYNRL